MKITKMKKFYLTGLIGAAGAILLLSLGNWQIARDDWKQDLLQRIADAPKKAVVNLSAIPEDQLEDYLYRRVRVKGKWGVGGNYFVIARTHKKRVGYHILGIVALPDNKHMLVNFGWVKHKQFSTRDTLPADFIGRLREAPSRSWFAAGHTPEKMEFSSIDPKAIGQRLGIDILPYYLDHVRPDTSQQPIPIANELTLPNNHLNYALTWYALTLIWVIIFIRLLWVLRRDRIERSG
jgi:surfeit locus 1 family protein